jgi:hypothetical protein
LSLLTNGVIDIGGNFLSALFTPVATLPPMSIALVVDLPPVSLILLVHLELRISVQISEKMKWDNQGLGEIKNLVTLSL